MTNYISIKVIIDDLTDHPLLKDLSEDRIINYTLLFLGILEIPKLFIDKATTIQIKKYRGELPCDFHRMEQVRVFKDSLCLTGVYSTDSFHMSEKKSYDNTKHFTYKLQGNCIFTSIEEGDVEIAYLAIAVDEDGLPLIPDNAAFINALELYIKSKYFTYLFDLGKINNLVLLNTLLEYTWAVGQARTSLLMPSVDEMQAITNGWNTMVVRSNEHSKGFVTNNIKEHFKIL